MSFLIVLDDYDPQTALDLEALAPAVAAIHKLRDQQQHQQQQGGDLNFYIDIAKVSSGLISGILVRYLVNRVKRATIKIDTADYTVTVSAASAKELKKLLEKGGIIYSLIASFRQENPTQQSVRISISEEPDK